MNDFHLVHYGARASGGAGLIFTEMTDVSADARITPGCAGMYDARTRRRLEAHRRLRPHAHQRQVRAPTRPRRPQRLDARAVEEDPNDRDYSDQPLETGNWEIIAPSPHRLVRTPTPRRAK